jgi:hypothetical protein
LTLGQNKRAQDNGALDKMAAGDGRGRQRRVFADERSASLADAFVVPLVDCNGQGELLSIVRCGPLGHPPGRGEF